MRIISKFKDYYDSLQTHEGELYLRETTLLKDEDRNFVLPVQPHVLVKHFYEHRKFVKEYIVGFCGKLYNGVLLYDPYEDAQDLREFSFRRNGKRQFPKNTKFCWKIEDVDKVFEKSKYKDYYYNGIPKGHYWKSPFNGSYTRSNMVKYFEVLETKINMDLGVPVFVVERPSEITVNFVTKRVSQNIFLNDCLKDIEFFKVMPVNQAFQEIEMFINNIAKPEKPIPIPDDDTMRDIKGFDKYSFRKDPSKKK